MNYIIITKSRVNGEMLVITEIIPTPEPKFLGFGLTKDQNGKTEIFCKIVDSEYVTKTCSIGTTSVFLPLDIENIEILFDKKNKELI